eukprot:SM000050S16967  [mRNA]  locus=s50:117284:120165:+ [translate_table: standard]
MPRERASRLAMSCASRRRRRGLREPWEADEEDAWKDDDEAEASAGFGDGDSGGGGGERSRALEGLLAAYGDPELLEEDDEPYESVPGPPLLAEDADMNDKVTALAYALKDCLPGRILKLSSECTDASADLFAMGFFDSAVEYQDPFICFRGAHRYREWLAGIARLGASDFFLEEIYYERLAEHRFKRWVHTVWTMTLTEDLEESLRKMGEWEWWKAAYEAALTEMREVKVEAGGLPDGNGMDSATWYWQAGDGEQPAAGESAEGGAARMSTALDMREERPGASRGDSGGVVEEGIAADAEVGHEALQLTGDSKYEMARSGKVTSITSGWYVLEGDGAAQLAKAHLYLVALASRDCEDDAAREESECKLNTK